MFRKHLMAWCERAIDTIFDKQCSVAMVSWQDDITGEVLGTVCIGLGSKAPVLVAMYAAALHDSEDIGLEKFEDGDLAPKVAVVLPKESGE